MYPAMMAGVGFPAWASCNQKAAFTPGWPMYARRFGKKRYPERRLLQHLKCPDRISHESERYFVGLLYLQFLETSCGVHAANACTIFKCAGEADKMDIQRILMRNVVSQKKKITGITFECSLQHAPFDTLACWFAADNQFTTRWCFVGSLA